MKKITIIAAMAVIMMSGQVFAEGTEAAETMKKNKLDLDGNGVVTKIEFMQHAEERFGKIDKDGNGEISKEEGKAAHKMMREKKKEFMSKAKDRRSSAGQGSGVSSE